MGYHYNLVQLFSAADRCFRLVFFRHNFFETIKWFRRNDKMVDFHHRISKDPIGTINTKMFIINIHNKWSGELANLVTTTLVSRRNGPLISPQI